MEDPNGNKIVLTPVIDPKLKSTYKCPVPAFTLCLLARSKKKSIGTKQKIYYTSKGRNTISRQV